MMMNRAPIRRCIASTARATQEARATTSANAETASATSAYGGGSSSAVDRFDSHSLIKQLRSAQFTEPQAEGVVRATVDAMTRAHFISRDAFERELMSARADTHALKVEMNASLREASAAMRHANESLVGETDKLRQDLKYNIDRITQSQKLDLNLEKGRLRELHAIQESQLKEIEGRVDRELHQMRTQIEAGKTEIIRYSVGTLVSLGALSLAAMRLVM